MCEKTVCFQHIDEIKEFVNAACRCSFDIDIVHDRKTIDAKSILGVLSLEYNKKLCVRYEQPDDAFESVLGKFAVA